MPPDVPADVRAVLTRLFAAARTAVREGDHEAAAAAVESAATVIEHKLPEGEFAARLDHGCRSALDAVGEDDDLAAGYLAAMERRVRAADDD